MKMNTKRIAGLALGAALALTVGAGVYSVVNAYEQPTVTASAATITKDLSNTIYCVNEHGNGDWGTLGDFKEAGLYRFWISTDKALAWNEGGTSLNEAGRDHLLEFVKVNGKTVKQWRDEYANGETNKITWEGMPGNTGGGNAMHQNIANDVANGTAVYAPIIVNLAQHVDGKGAPLGGALDIYVPNSFIADVTSIEILKGFEWSYNGEVYGFNEDIYFGCNSLKVPYKVVGERNLNVIETNVTSIDGSYGKVDDGKVDQFLSFYLSENDYGTGNTIALTDKNFLRSINFFDYILIDGKTMGSLYLSNGIYENPAEQFFNVWSRTGSFSLRWPTSLKGDLSKTDAVKEIKILAGCQFPSKEDASTVYQTTEDITFTRQESGAFADINSLIDADDVSIAWATKYGDKDEIYKVDIICTDWTYNLVGGDIYDLNYSGDGRNEVRDNILINGKSISYINANTDTTGYNWVTFPYTDNENSASTFQKPVLVYVSGNILSLFIHEGYVDTLCKEFGDELVVTVKKEICNSSRIVGKILTEDVVATAYGIGYDLVLMNGEEKVDTMSVLGGVALNNLPKLTDDHKIFVGWVDADGNPAPAVMPAESSTLYAKWNIKPYTLTIQYLDGTSKNFTFGVEIDEENGIMLSTADLAKVLEDNLPENTEEVGYDYEEKIPYEFKGQNYTFTVKTVRVSFTITFVGENDEDLGIPPITFTAKTIDSLQLPAVPEKAGYKGAWDKTLDRIKMEDTVLKAVYTEIKETPTIPNTPDNSTDSTVDSTDSTSEEQSGNAGLLAGCSGVVGGIAGGMLALGVAAVALLKKKED